MNYHNLNEKITVTDYPYGRLRTTVFYSIEFKKGKGFREVFQSINPKNGVLNKPKLSTYYDILVLFTNEIGHVKSAAFNFNGKEDIQKSLAFLSENYDLFTTEQIKDICLSVLASLRVDIYTTVQYCGAKLEDIKPFYAEAIKTLVIGANEGTNIFPLINIDWEGINDAKVEGYNPFKTTHMVTLG